MRGETKKPEKRSYEYELKHGRLANLDYISGYNYGITAMDAYWRESVKNLYDDLLAVKHHTIDEELWRVKKLLEELNGK